MGENNINGGIPSILPSRNLEPQREDQKRTTEMYRGQPQVAGDVTDVLYNDIIKGRYDGGGTADVQGMETRLSNNGMVDVQATIDALNMLGNVPFDASALPLPEDVKLYLENITTYGRLREIYERLYEIEKTVRIEPDDTSKKRIQ